MKTQTLFIESNGLF